MDATIFKGFSVFSGVSASDATPCVDFNEFTEAEDDFVDLLGKFTSGGKNNGLAFGWLRVNQLEQTNGKGCGFAGTWLCLGNGILLGDDGGDPLLLNDGWLLEPESWIDGGLP